MCSKGDNSFMVFGFLWVLVFLPFLFMMRTISNRQDLAQRIDNKNESILVDNADALFEAVCLVESGDNNFAINEKEDAVGVVQIRPICVEDCNRISGGVNYCLRDRFDKNKSKEMFYLYTDYYMKYFKRTTNEDRCRIWNGGPKGWCKKSTVSYWDKVNSIYSKNIK